MATVNLGKVVTTPKGNYVSSTPYGILDEVYDDVNNITYVSLKDANTDALTTTTSWMVIAKGIGVTTDNNYINADKAKVTALPSAAPGGTDGLALYNTLAAFVALKGVANGLPSTNASNQVIQDALNSLSLGGILAVNYATMTSATPTLLNGWTEPAAGYYKFSVSKSGNIVVINALLTGGIVDAASSMFSVPTEFSPKVGKAIVIVFVQDSSNVWYTNYVEIGTDGIFTHVLVFPTNYRLFISAAYGI